MRALGRCVACGKKGEPIRKSGKIVGRRRFCTSHIKKEAKNRLASYHRTKVLTGRKKKSELVCSYPAE